MPRNDDKPTNRPIPPEHLEGEALLEWHRVCDELHSQNRLEKVDRAVLTLYAETWATWQGALRHVAKYGAVIKLHNNVAGRNPYYQVMRESALILRQLLADMKLTPACRRGTDSQIVTDDLPL